MIAGLVRRYFKAAISLVPLMALALAMTGFSGSPQGLTIDAPDLVVSTPSVSDNNPAAGASFTLSATVRNQGSAGSAAATLHYYRSADTTITTYDTELGTDSVSALAAFGTSDQSIDLTAPSDTGDYYYGACVDTVSDESSTTNNCSSAVTVTVGPTAPDLVISSHFILMKRVYPSLVYFEAGHKVWARATVKNEGSGASSAATVRFYWSTDDTITSSDIEGGTVSLDGLAAAATDELPWFYMNTPNPPGLYYFGVCVDAVSGESDTTNNCRSSSHRVRMVGSDLTVGLYRYGGNPVVSEFFGLDSTVYNSGRGGASATTVRYYRSTDDTITTSDTELGTNGVRELSRSGEKSHREFGLFAPSTAGAYYYGACVDPVATESDTTNNCSGALKVTVDATAAPDLLVYGPYLHQDRVAFQSAGNPQVGASFTLDATVRNQGSASAGSTTLRYYRSTDSTITSSDTAVGTDSVNGLAKGSYSYQSVDLTAPSDAGTYYYGACVDTVTDESVTTNNCSSGEKVIVEAEPAPDLVVGTPEVGETLTADTSGISDVDGLDNVAYSYQWIANDGTADTEIAGATGSTYTLAAADEGKTIKVKVTFTDDEGNAESLTSAATAEVAARPNSPATGAPTISGTVQVGEALTASTSGIADDDGLTNVTYSYQWIRNDGSSDTDILGATDSTYTLVAADQGKTIKVKVSFTDDADNEETLTSTATAEVAVGAPTDPPGSPSNLTGVTNSDGTVTLSWDAPDDDSVTGYQILRRRPSEGENTLLVHVNDTRNTATEYTDSAVTPDVLHAYRVKAINAVGLSSQSNFVNVTPGQTTEPAQNSPATGTPQISGTAQVGETLTASTSRIADSDGLNNAAFSYRWIRNDGSTDTDIQDATGSSYTLVDADAGQTIKVKVTFTDDADNQESLTSAATAAVAPEPNSPATRLPTISGTARVGDTLTADTSGIEDANGLDNVTFNYQWLADDAEINGATASTYTLADADQGKTIRVRVFFTDDADNQETLTSATTAAVAPPPNTPATGAPTISGTAQAGETLTSSTTGIADGDGLTNATFTYQWLADDADIAGATGSSYTLVDADEGKAVKVRVSFTDDGGNEESLTSEPTAAVAEAAATEPPPAAQNLVGTVNSDGSVTLSWEAPSDDSITGYQILRRRPTEGEHTLLVYVVDTRSAATTYTDTNVTAGVQHAYRVKAINAAGAGPVSNFVNVTP